MSIQISDISELGNAFIIQDRDANVPLLKREELERASAIWAEVVDKEVLEF